MANAKSKGRNVRRSSGKRKNRPKVRFSIWGLILLFAFAFAGCFVLYMVKANLDENFLEEEFGSASIIEEVPTVENENTEADTINYDGSKSGIKSFKSLFKK